MSKSRSSINPDILDATCGGRSIWTDANKDREDTLYIDRREVEVGELGENLGNFSVEPDEVQDFRDLPYPDESFNLIVFDPPHKKLSGGMKHLDGVMNKRYGALQVETWQSDLERGFDELWRVLRPGGTLVFKFNDYQVDFESVLNLAPTDPLFGTRMKRKSRGQTRWFVFYKPEEGPR